MLLLNKILQAALVTAIRGFKAMISPLLGNNCRFHPTCSDYACESIVRHGSVRGLWLTTQRVLRCNPLCEGGLDPVPPTSKS